MRQFNTSGPNIPEKHYTIQRIALVGKGQRLVEDDRYFTIWAPRQTGKSTYFRQLAERLEKDGYKVVHVNFENYKTASLEAFLYEFTKRLKMVWGIDMTGETEISRVFSLITEINDAKLVLIIDEVEGINPEYFGTFLHSIRSAYHSRQTHGLKSVILVGVTNILGVVQDNASPFNIADNLDVPYFTDQEVFELLGQHEVETGQRFDTAVKEKICQITANQPGLVNGFAHQLVQRYPNQPIITLEDYLVVEDWYLTEAIDKNFENILKIAKQERPFVERLLFTADRIAFTIDRPSIKLLHTNGLIKKDEEGDVAFWVPFYKKRLYNAFYPYTNGEKQNILRSLALSELFDAEGRLQLDRLIEGYKAYVKRRGFNAFREKDEDGNYRSIREAALIYSFETYIQAFLQAAGGKSYREAHVGLGRSDLIINILDAAGRRGGKNELFLPQPKAFSGGIAALRAPKKAQAGGKTAILPPRGSRRIKYNTEGAEYLIESKVYYYERQFTTGKQQLAYYCQSLGLQTGVYLVFCPNNIRYPESVRESVEVIDGVEIRAYLVEYDEKTW